jgi:hypothetical protein
LQALRQGNASVLKLVDGHILVLNDALILLLVLQCLVNFVSGCTASLLLDVRGKTEGLGSTARVRALVAAILKFRLL